MGSSPVTATNSVRSFLAGPAAFSTHEVLGLAFSGGPDSLALLCVLREILGAQRLAVLHVDHAVGGSAGRAALARAISLRLGVPFVGRRVDVAALKGPGENWEAAARRLRYAALDEMADGAGAARIATAHHLADQAETVIQRLQAGSDWMGLAGIYPVHGRWLRPALRVSRSELHAALAGCGCVPLEDPTNRHLERQRARTRHALLPGLVAGADPASDLAKQLAGLAERSRSSQTRLIQNPPALPNVTPGSALERLAFWLSARNGRVPQPGRRALASGRRNLAPAPRFHGRGAVLWMGTSPLVGNRSRTLSTPFSYSFEAPGSIDIPEIGLRLSLLPERVARWMFEGRAEAVGLVFAGNSGGLIVEVRSRRPGDRLNVLGMNRSRRLKDVLIDRKVPAADRDRIPLLCHQGNIAWVPGVTVGEWFRLRDETTCWVASLQPIGND